MSRRVLITGISSFLGHALASALEDSEEVEYIAGVGLREPDSPYRKTEFIRADIRSPLILKVISSNEIDTIVHADLTSTPSGSGGRSVQKERNVIGTMQLLGAAQRAETVKKVIVRSSTAVYGASPGDPSILTEDRSEKTHIEGGYARDVSDAEAFARDFGRRRPDVLLTILRFANVIGPTAETNMTQLFSLPFVPTAIGFDPRLQVLHESDAIEVLTSATLEDHPGVYNVAADGVVYLSQAIRLARRIPVPIASQLATMAGDILKRIGLVDFSTEQISLLLHGRVIDTTRLKTVFGYSPRYSTYDAFRDFLNARREAVGPTVISDWERELYDYLVRLGTQRAGPPKPYLVHDQRREAK